MEYGYGFGYGLSLRMNCWWNTICHLMYDTVIILSPFLSPSKKERKKRKDSTKGDILWFIKLLII